MRHDLPDDWGPSYVDAPHDEDFGPETYWAYSPIPRYPVYPAHNPASDSIHNGSPALVPSPVSPLPSPIIPMESPVDTVQVEAEVKNEEIEENLKPSAPKKSAAKLFLEAHETMQDLTEVSRSSVAMRDIGEPLLHLLFWFLIYVVYTFLVGLIFLAIERQPRENSIDASYAEFVAQNFSASTTVYLQQKFGLGIPYANSTRKWDYLSSMYYVITYSSTIGYGDFFPITAAGRWMTFMFGFIGIPLLGVTFVKSGKYFVRFATALPLLLLSPCLGIRFKPGKALQADQVIAKCSTSVEALSVMDLRDILQHWDDGDGVTWLDVCRVLEVADINGSGRLEADQIKKALLLWSHETADQRIRASHILLMYVFFLVISWISFSAFIFSVLEDYSWSTGWWFSYVTLTTIGYGDVVATNIKSRLYWILFVYLGVGLMAWLLVALADRIVRIGATMKRRGFYFSPYHDVTWHHTSLSKAIAWLRPLVVPLTVLLGYAALGGAMFESLEKEFSEEKLNAQMAIWNQTTFTPSQKEYLEANLQFQYIWTFIRSFMFALVSVTTIGYGTTVPSTPGGKGLLILYALLGIGLVAYFLGQLAYCFFHAITSTVAFLSRLAGRELNLLDNDFFEEKAQQLFEAVTHVDKLPVEETCEMIERILHKMDRAKIRKLVLEVDDGDGLLDSEELMVLMARWLTRKRRQMAITNMAINSAMLIILIFIFSGIYVGLEGWTYGDALWFSWVTLATIGFGDITPDTEAGAIFTIFVVLINMGFFANCISLAGPVINAVFIVGRNKWVQSRSGGAKKHLK